MLRGSEEMGYSSQMEAQRIYGGAESGLVSKKSSYRCVKKQPAQERALQAEAEEWTHLEEEARLADCSVSRWKIA